VSRVAVVTGGAGHLGAAVASRLARDGLRLALIDRDADRVARAAETLSATGATCRGYRGDVEVPDEVAAAVAAAQRDLGDPLVLVTCAGLSPKRQGGPPAPDEISAAEWQQVLNVNLTGVFLAIQAVLPAMRAAGFGRVVNVSSAAARVPSPTAGAHYSAAKAGVLGLTRALAAQLAPHGILVVAVAPGKMRNPHWPDDERLVRRYVERVPLGRLAEAEEVAELISFLCSERNTYVTGATVDIDGGRSPA
jgi:3-oxoacyl-[acyl-carrier protein] reductase